MNGIAGVDVESNDADLPILQLARTFSCVDFGFVPKHKNSIAHRLARSGRFLDPSSTLSLRPPRPARSLGLADGGPSLIAHQWRFPRFRRFAFFSGILGKSQLAGAAGGAHRAERRVGDEDEVDVLRVER